MVGFAKMGWRSSDNNKSSKTGDDINKMGILSFETAKIMSRLLCLYKSLSKSEISNLKTEMKLGGVSYLNSKDEGFLLSLACAERLEDLDKAAAAVARLGHKCSDFGLNRFDLVYTDLKLGIIDFGKLEYGSKDIEKRVFKMEKLINATSGLYAALENLAELEVSERKMKQWKERKASGQLQKVNLDMFNQKIEQQRKQVRQFREKSLWNQTFDKSVGHMARIVCIIYARICVVFGPYIPILPSLSLRNMRSSQQKEILKFQPENCLIEPIREQIISRSGPIPMTSKPTLVRFYSRKSIFFLCEDEGFGADKLAKNNRVFHAAGPLTVGGAGLALRYANVITLVEKYLNPSESVDLNSRENLYQMLPGNLKITVRSKLSKNLKCMDEDESLAEGWRDALNQIMEWLAPMAHNTINWQLERSLEKTKFDIKPSVLLLQTLHYSDKEKTEAAIADILVGLSCICKCENRQWSES
ncbi:protein PSK SIMULATOR 1-like [Solanum verrucosum]|uniref:protein PSK SIMULATOR 1-like n=1 Tax=Solanum verrucosum TaxID=315347 RepID=UPI0020D0016A|nr:protein PSK SIMULATOR 1-like [Solanum verrucosum]